MKNIMRHIIGKFDFRATIRELKHLGKVHGPRFLIYAVAIEVFEDVILPGFFILIGKPTLAPVALAFHMEPVAYPVYFAVAGYLGRRK